MAYVAGGTLLGDPVAARCFDVTEVTVKDYSVCVTRGRCAQADTWSVSLTCNKGHVDRLAHPINCVDRDQAAAYCEFVEKRLPTSLEWEWAARGRDEGRTYPWGEEPVDCERAVHNPIHPGCREGRSWPVGSKPAGRSRDGLEDMAGNVWEWTASGSSHKAVIRGGSWVELSDEKFSAARHETTPAGTRSDGGGFRCVQAPAGAGAEEGSPGASPGGPAVISRLALEDNHACFIVAPRAAPERGQVWCWGADPAWSRGQRSGELWTASPVDHTRGAVDIALSSSRLYTVDRAGVLRSWSATSRVPPRRHEFPEPVTEIVRGLYLLGRGRDGQVWLLDDHKRDESTLSVLAEAGVTAIGGGDMGCLLSRDHELRCTFARTLEYAGKLPRELRALPFEDYSKRPLLLGTFPDARTDDRALTNSYTVAFAKLAAVCVIDNKGQLLCPGGTIDGSWLKTRAARPVPGYTDIELARTFVFYACAIKRGTGEVVCSGDNAAGTLGDGTKTSRRSPRPTLGLSGARELELSELMACAVAPGRGESDAVYCWGRPRLDNVPAVSLRAKVELPGPARALAAAGRMSCAQLEDGALWCWGVEPLVTAGHWLKTDPAPRPLALRGGSLGELAAMHVAREDMCLLDQDGLMLCGRLTNDRGALRVHARRRDVVAVSEGSFACHLSRGRDTPSCSDPPEDVELPALAELTALAGSSSELLLLHGGGQVRRVSVAGAEDVPGLTDAVAVSDNVILRAGGQLVTSLGSLLGPMRTLDVRDITRFAGRDDEVCALNKDGELGCWIYNNAGLHREPVELPPAADVVTGSEHTCVLTRAGEVWCWGDNGHGELGKYTGEMLVPTILPGLPE